ncbi:hypothetical protein CHARACLAT_010918 [Characodon lateralis]|uniref:Uncharacterized protein n=1 Tax=Characodon lateralis TaxID=208331 RepID=A0ABU7DJD9_9TELE|nr:hypothetical protein [Characodon lateralis]
MKHLYCAGKIGNATEDKLSDCIGLFGKGSSFTSEHHVSPHPLTRSGEWCHRLTEKTLVWGTEMVSIWLQTHISFSKQTPTMKIYSEEAVQAC